MILLIQRFLWKKSAFYLNQWHESCVRHFLALFLDFVSSKVTILKNINNTDLDSLS